MAETEEKNLIHPKNDDYEDAPESGTVVQEDNPSQPMEADKDGKPDSVGEAPESGTLRDR